MNRVSKALLAVGLLSFLAACSDPQDDLNTWVKSIKAQPVGVVEPLPEVKQIPSFEYTAFDLRSPFAELEVELETELLEIAEGCDATIRPDPNRTREDLERFSLDSLEMVGAMKNQAQNWGLVRTTTGPTAGTIYKVSQDNYLGINHGKIVDINEFRIVVETLVPDGQGCWEKRVINLALNE